MTNEDTPPRGSPEWWDARYLSGDIPWDTGIVPPEVVSLVEDFGVRGRSKASVVQSAAGDTRPWALDIGCGSGLSSRYLAGHAYRVVGVDLAQSALGRANHAARLADLPAYFCRASVADLAFLDVTAALAIDVGCFHALPPELRRAYVVSLAEHLLPGAPYLLYAFEPGTGADGAPSGIGPSDIGLFARYFSLSWTQHGTDGDRASAWYLMLRNPRRH
jgi:SAM-dependent methyltransferase